MVEVAVIPISTFLDLARRQNGKPYIFGATAKLSDPDPPAFDCSELIKWTAGRLGVKIPDGAVNQYPFLKKRGLALPVAEAIKTPGAILFKHGLNRHAAIYHVGISEGNGRVFEAKGSKYGVGSFKLGTWAPDPATKENVWNLAAKLPGFTYSGGFNVNPVLALLAGAAAAFYL